VGGRIYVDTTAALRLAPTRRVLLRILRAVYPDLAAGVADLADRPEVKAARGPRPAALFMLARMLWSVPFRLGWMFLGARLEGQVDWGTRLIADNVAEFRAAALAQPAGAARLRAVLQEATRLPRSPGRRGPAAHARQGRRVPGRGARPARRRRPPARRPA